MKIGIFTDTYYPDANGVAQSVEVLSKRLIELKNSVYIFCPGKNLTIQKEGNIIRIPGLEVKKLYGYKISQPLHPLLEQEVKDLHLDIIHAETEFGVGTMGNIIAHRLNIPLVRTYHTDYVDYTHYFINEDLGLIYKGAKDLVSLWAKGYGDSCLRLMTPSNKTKEGLLLANIKTPIEVVPNGIDLNRFNNKNFSINDINNLKKSLNIKDDEKIFIYVGRIAEEKRVNLLIDAIKDIKNYKLKIKLLIVGLGTAYDKLVKYVKENKLDDYIIFTGKVDPNAVPLYYHIADYFISASTSETQGLTYIEALSSGLPLIVAYDDVLSDLVEEGINGYFFNDLKECETKIIKSYNLSNSEYSNMKDNAIKSTKKFDDFTFAYKTLEIYEEVVEEFKLSYRVIKTRLVGDLVKLTLTNGLNEDIKVSMTVDDYYAKGYRKDTLISKSSLEELIKNETFVLAYKYCLKKLSIKDYSINNLKDAIYRKFQLSKEDLDRVINKLIENNLLNDDNYTISRISILKESLLSKKAILNKLLKDGISKELFEKYYIDNPEEELIKLKKKALKYQTSIKNKSLYVKKQMILTKLVNDGFNLDSSKQIINELDFSKEKLAEVDLLKKETIKAYNKYSKKYESTELRNRIYHYLISKGFNETNIYTIINEMGY